MKTISKRARSPDLHNTYVLHEEIDVTNRKIICGPILASDHIAKERRKVCWMFRQMPEHEQDSGWRVFSGDETQEYADDASHLAWYNASTIVAIDPSIAPYLDAPVGSAFERESGDEEFVAVSDFDTSDNE
jgi:hypothetical protein